MRDLGERKACRGKGFGIYRKGQKGLHGGREKCGSSGTLGFIKRGRGLYMGECISAAPWGDDRASFCIAEKKDKEKGGPGRKKEKKRN